MREPAGASFLVEVGAGGDGHNGELAIIVYPRAGLVCLFETPNLVGGVGVCPSVSHKTCHRSPEIHSPRHRGRRVGVSRGKGVLGHSSYQGAYIVDRGDVLRVCRSGDGGK